MTVRSAACQILGGELLTDSQDIQAVIEHSGGQSRAESLFGSPLYLSGLIVVYTGDGGYDEVWATDYRRPFDCVTPYWRIVNNR